LSFIVNDCVDTDKKVSGWDRNHRRTAVPPCANGDIAIQWEWSNFDPSQKPNPVTDYDKTWHN